MRYNTGHSFHLKALPQALTLQAMSMAVVSGFRPDVGTLTMPSPIESFLAFNGAQLYSSHNSSFAHWQYNHRNSMQRIAFDLPWLQMQIQNTHNLSA